MWKAKVKQLAFKKKVKQLISLISNNVVSNQTAAINRKKNNSQHNAHDSNNWSVRKEKQSILCYLDSSKSIKYPCRALDTPTWVWDSCPMYFVGHSPRKHIFQMQETWTSYVSKISNQTWPGRQMWHLILKVQQEPKRIALKSHTLVWHDHRMLNLRHFSSKIHKCLCILLNGFESSHQGMQCSPPIKIILWFLQLCW